MLSLKEIMRKYFKDQKLIKSETNGFYILKFDKVIDQNNIKFVMSLNIPGYISLDVNKVPNMDKFMTYIYEVKENIDLNKINNIKNFPIYDQLKNRNNFYLDIQKNKLKKQPKFSNIFSNRSCI
jgi:hypothetical protein